MNKECVAIEYLNKECVVKVINDILYWFVFHNKINQQKLL